MDFKEMSVIARKYREHLLEDIYRPVYHFAVPDGLGFPGDTNGAFYADGLYHLMYLYRNLDTNAYHWGHMTSVDLIHWRHHADALTTYKGDEGCYSGGAFVDDDGTAYLTFWKFRSKEEGGDFGGIAIARAKAPYEVWERMEPIAVEHTEWGIKELTIDGKTHYMGCADPSNIWKCGDFYYLQTGNYCVLHNHGWEEDAPEEFRGDWTDLFRSKDLKNWEYVHRFYKNPALGQNDWPDRTEDDMCPSFLPLFDAKENGNPTDKWLQLFISHNRGCQYYIGKFENETFFPEQHGRMTWKDNAYFAPEALVDDKNRHIIFTWLRDNIKDDFGSQDFARFGWNGSYALPRAVWLQNGELHMAPVDEIDRLQYNHQAPEIAKDGHISVSDGRVFRLKAILDTANGNVGIRVCENADGYLDIYYDKSREVLVFDTTHPIAEKGCSKEEAPLCLRDGEALSLDILVDKSVIEVYANERQAIGRRIYPNTPSNDMAVSLIGSPDCVQSLDVWDMAPTNPF